MKRSYIAPKTDIETLRLEDSVLEEIGVAKYSHTSNTMSSNSGNFDEDDNIEDPTQAPSSLWDE